MIKTKNGLVVGFCPICVGNLLYREGNLYYSCESCDFSEDLSRDGYNEIINYLNSESEEDDK